jgi:hypothetical protein
LEGRALIGDVEPQQLDSYCKNKPEMRVEQEGGAQACLLCVS